MLEIEWLDSVGRNSFVAVGLSIESVCSLPNTLNSAWPSFSTSLTHRLMSAGVAVISAMSKILLARTIVSLELKVTERRKRQG